jgi:hypothetical protein
MSARRAGCGGDGALDGSMMTVVIAIAGLVVIAAVGVAASALGSADKITTPQPSATCVTTRGDSIMSRN